jgi:hypothetical protein
MFGWFSKRSRDAEAPIAEPDVAPPEPVMREIPARPAAPPGAAPPPAEPVTPKNGTSAPHPLIDWLKNPDADTRVAAARELGRRGDPAAVEPLIEALRDVSGPVRIAACNALGKLRDERAIDALADTLSNDHESGVQSAARGALEALGTARADAAVAEFDIRQAPPVPVEDAPVQPAALEAPPAEPSPLERFVAALRSDDPATYGGAMASLAEAGPAAVDALIPLLRDHDELGARKRAADVLGTIGDARAAEPLAAALEAISPHDRSFETYQFRESLRAALANVTPPPQQQQQPAPELIATTTPIATPEPVAIAESAPPEVPVTSAQTPAPVAPPPTPPTESIPGITDATDQQLGERLLEIAHAALGGGKPPLDSFDARRAIARAIGEELNRRGGFSAMERALDNHVGPLPGRHSISQAWDGVGEWLG